MVTAVGQQVLHGQSEVRWQRLEGLWRAHPHSSGATAAAGLHGGCSRKCFDALVKERDAPPPEPVDEAPEIIPERGPHSIDDDCGTYVCQFLEGDSLLIYARCSSATKTWMDESVGDAVWRSLHKRDQLERCPWLASDDSD